MSAVVAAMVTYALPLVSLELAVLMVSIVLCHELGHRGIAKFFGANAGWPIIISIGVVCIGITCVYDLTVTQRAYVAIAGPVCGLTFGLASLAKAWLTDGLLMASFVLSFNEASHLVLGSDAKAYRSNKK